MILKKIKAHMCNGKCLRYASFCNLVQLARVHSDINIILATFLYNFFYKVYPFWLQT